MATIMAPGGYMKIPASKEFMEWFNEYKETANYYVALSPNSKLQTDALFLCMRDSFMQGEHLTKENIRLDSKTVDKHFTK